LTELPNLLRQALADHDELQGLDYQLLVVDEYQDLNACDLEVLRRLGERGSAIIATGDDDQSIYSFRKAAPEGIPVSDTDVVNRALGEHQNRQSLELLRLLANPLDSLAWAALLKLARGIGEAFVTYVYDYARANRLTFGVAFGQLYERQFDGAPKAVATRAMLLAAQVHVWIEENELPEARPDNGWGDFVTTIRRDGLFLGFTDKLAEILTGLDGLDDPADDFARFLNQIAPAGKDLVASKSQGVRIMTMASSKGSQSTQPSWSLRRRALSRGLKLNSQRSAAFCTWQ
jgi:superfamily I DNA/RNA helicase